MQPVNPNPMLSGCMNVLKFFEVHPIERPASTSREGSWRFTATRRVLAESHIAHIMQAIFNGPMLTNTGVGLFGVEHARTTMPGGFLAIFPALVCHMEDIGGALDPHQAADTGPFRQFFGDAGRQWPYCGTT